MKKKNKYAVINGAAMIPAHGITTQRINIFSDIRKKRYLKRLKQNIFSALLDDSVDKVVLEINAPGEKNIKSYDDFCKKLIRHISTTFDIPEKFLLRNYKKYR